MKKYLPVEATISTRKALSKLPRLIRHEDWNVGVIHQPIHTVVECGINGKVRWLSLKGQGIFMADPFGVFVNGELYILCEKFDYSEGTGKLLSIRFARDGSIEELEPDLICPFHLAYPYLIQHNGDIFCIPETSRAAEVRLYRAIEFPRTWEHVHTLIRGIRAVDVTVFYHKSLWWMWFTNADTGTNSDLHVWYAEDITGKWLAHAKNPVKSCASSSRPAGTPYVDKGKLFRPAQDCSRKYGANIVVNEVLNLSPARYEEREAARLMPDPASPYMTGIHTISSVGPLTLIDARRMIFIPQGLKLAVRKGIRFLTHKYHHDFAAGKAI